MENYFVKVFADRAPNEPVSVKEVLPFYGEKELFAWMQEHREESFSVYKAECVLDYS